jgi:hypothetical protein
MPSFDETISECRVGLYMGGLGFCLFLFHMFICSYVFACLVDGHRQIVNNVELSFLSI